MPLIEFFSSSSSEILEAEPVKNRPFKPAGLLNQVADPNH